MLVQSINSEAPEGNHTWMSQQPFQQSQKRSLTTFESLKVFYDLDIRLFFLFWKSEGQAANG